MNLKSIEQTAPGHIACQVIDIIHPKTVQMSKIKWGACQEYEYIINYKILQNALAKNNIKRYVDVDKLIKCRPLDNIEFMQWLKGYYDRMNPSLDGYNALERRGHQNPPNCQPDKTKHSRMRPTSPHSFCNPNNLLLKDKNEVLNLNKEKKIGSNNMRVSKMTNQSLNNSQTNLKNQLNVDKKELLELENEVLNHKLKIDDLENELNSSNIDKNF